MINALVQDDRGFYFDRAPQDFIDLNGQIEAQNYAYDGYSYLIKIPDVIKGLKVPVHIKIYRRNDSRRRVGIGFDHVFPSPFAIYSSLYFHSDVVNI
jgi:hypothetical protein